MKCAEIIILSFTIIGSIFVNSSLLTDTQILPKWLCFVIGVALMAFDLGFQLLQGSTFMSRKSKTTIACTIYLKHSSRQREIMLADNVKHVFNDYLAIAIQFGVVGILVLILVVIFNMEIMAMDILQFIIVVFMIII